MTFDSMPYTNFHELNLDWILNEVKVLKDNAGSEAEAIEEIKRFMANVQVDEAGRVIVDKAKLLTQGYGSTGKPVYIDVDGTPKPATYFDGNASTASKLAVGRNINLVGDVVGSATFDGSNNITIATRVEGSSPEPGSITLIDNDLTINGNLTMADNKHIVLDGDDSYVAAKMFTSERVETDYIEAITIGPEQGETLTVTGNLIGNVTGNVTGNLTGDVDGSAVYADTAGTLTDLTATVSDINGFNNRINTLEAKANITYGTHEPTTDDFEKVGDVYIKLEA